MEQQYMAPIIVGLLTFLGVLAKTIIDFIKLRNENRKSKLIISKLKDENMTQKVNLNVFNNLLKLKLYTRLEKVAKKIFSKTKADRFLILIAVNGKVSPNSVTALFSEQSSEVEDSDLRPEETYRHIQIDNEYRDLLKCIENNGMSHLDVLRMKPGMLKDFYYIEEVSYSLVFFIKRYHITDEDDVLVYCSVATHEDDDFTSLEMTRIKAEIESNVNPLIDKLII